MATPPKERYSISEVSERTGVPVYTLRQWEQHFPMLRPRRTRTNRRFYEDHDIEIALLIKECLWVRKMKADGARVYIAQKLHGVGRPKTRREAIEILDRMEKEMRALLDLLDKDL
jgi:DNA-binding transcriptional MerR regulator